MRCSSALALLALVTGQAAAQEPAALDARLSPDGTQVVARAIDARSIRLLAVTPYDSSSEPRWLTPPGEDVGAVSWTPDGARVVYRAGDDGHLYLLGVDASTAPSDLTPGVDGEVRLAGFAGDTAALVELPGEWADRPDLYRVPLTGGEPVLVQENDGGVSEWVVHGGAARLAVREGEAGDEEIARLRDGMVLPVYACGEAAVCEPLGLHPDGRIWLRTDRDRSEPALVLADPLTLAVDVVRPSLGIDTGAVIRADSLYSRDVARLRDLLGDAEISFHEEPRASDGRMLVTARSAESATLYVFDRWAGSLQRVLPMADEGTLLGATGVAAPQPDPTVVWPEELRYLVSSGEPGMPPTDVRRTIERTSEGDRPVLVVVDETEVPVFPAFQLDTALLQDPAFEPDLSFPMDDLDTEQVTDSTVLDATTLRPIRRRASGPLSIELDFGPDGVSGLVTMHGFETRVSATADGPIWTDGAALELLVAALPLTEGYRTEVVYFDSGLREVVTARLSVADGGRVETEAGDFEAWAVSISSSLGEAGDETWLVKRSAPHTLLRATVETRDYERAAELIDEELP